MSFPPRLPPRAVSFHQEREMEVCKVELVLVGFKIQEGLDFYFQRCVRGGGKCVGKCAFCFLAYLSPAFSVTALCDDLPQVLLPL